MYWQVYVAIQGQIQRLSSGQRSLVQMYSSSAIYIIYRLLHSNINLNQLINSIVIHRCKFHDIIQYDIIQYLQFFVKSNRNKIRHIVDICLTLTVPLFEWPQHMSSMKSNKAFVLTCKRSRWKSRLTREQTPLWSSIIQHKLRLFLSWAISCNVCHRVILMQQTRKYMAWRNSHIMLVLIHVTPQLTFSVVQQTTQRCESISTTRFLF